MIYGLPCSELLDRYQERKPGVVVRKLGDINLRGRCLTSTLEKKIDALDNWCLRRILHIHWTDFVSNDVVRSHTGQPLLSDTIRQRRLSFFGHLCRANTSQDHFRALRACIRVFPETGDKELEDRGKPG